MYRLARVAFLAFVLIREVCAFGDEPKIALRGGETILFFGDSITQAGHYVDLIDADLISRFPDKTFNIINHGISSETLSGSSEPDHEPPRPCALDRFTRDVARWRPDVVVACFGMNDGIYHPFDEARFLQFQRGVLTLVDRLRVEVSGARLILVTPPPFDPYRRQVGDANAKHYGYKFAALGYDDVLTRYSAWETSLSLPDVIVVDAHTALGDYLARMRQEAVSGYLAADGVHPGQTGHELMAAEVLKMIHVTDAKTREAASGRSWHDFHAGGRMAELFQRLEARNQRRYEHWRKLITTESPDDDRELPADDEAATNHIRSLATRG